MEQCELALAHSTIYQQNLRSYHNHQVRGRAFTEGDLVLQLSQKIEGKHKLSPLWEGPFIISKVLQNGAYRLYNLNKKDEEPRTWNADLLRWFYT